MLRTILCLIFIVTCFHVYAQDGYPKPEKTENHLFYIQHSNNHNTFVYEANVKNNHIVESKPIKKYQIVFEGNGEKKPLSRLQRRFAYGMTVEESSSNLFKLRLAASNKMYFYLYYDQNDGAKIYVTVKNHKINLNRMFIQLKNNNIGLNAQVDYVLFYGTDFNTKEPVIEKVFLH